MGLQTRRPETLGQRLREAINNWGSIRRFASVLSDKGLTGKGATRAMVHRYLADETRPPLEFIRAAAEVLGVREEWIQDGQGESTAARQNASEATSASASTVLELMPQLHAALPALGNFAPLDKVAITTALFRLAALDHQTAHQIGPEVELDELYRNYWTTIEKPLHWWSKHFGETLNLDAGDMTKYVVAMVNAMELATELVRGATWETLRSRRKTVAKAPRTHGDL